MDSDRALLTDYRAFGEARRTPLWTEGQPHPELAAWERSSNGASQFVGSSIVVGDASHPVDSGLFPDSSVTLQLRVWETWIAIWREIVERTDRGKRIHWRYRVAALAVAKIDDCQSLLSLLVQD